MWVGSKERVRYDGAWYDVKHVSTEYGCCRLELESRLGLERLKQARSKVLKGVARRVPRLIRRSIKERYTYKGAISIRTRQSGARAQVVVRGSRQTIKHFRTRAPTKGRHLYAEVIRGQGGSIRRGFRHNGTYFKRLTATRLPIQAIYGPSTAEMAGHEPAPATGLGRQIETLIEARLMELGL